ncbi:MAG TPA: aminotransferase class V-fold PLP-dependent enzyme, partial [Thermoanaerobaculia bacterium]|nr:aminotransferase class V-fold PLP-dependent enzyme [Thermoanaerobaculia bacterium]
MIHSDPSGYEPGPRLRPARPVSFLPGPVAVHPTVHEAFTRPAVSHRAAAFLEEIQTVRRRLCELAGARHVQVLLGSGTLANDAVAAQISLLGRGQRGIVLTNGEFGDRLADHARRFGLEASVLEAGWGEALPYERARRALAAGRFHWLWAAHCETSTGVLNDLDRLKTLAREAGVRLCLDAISSLGTVPVDLDGVDLASGVSGKG